MPIEDLGGADITGAANSALVNRLVLPEIDKLSPRERKTMLAAVIVWFFVLTPAAGYVLILLLSQWIEFRTGGVDPSTVVLAANWAMLMVPAGFVAFSITGVALSLLLEWSKWEASAAMFWCLLFVAGFLGVNVFCSVALADWYAVVAADHIRYNPFLSVNEQTYWHDQAASIRSATDQSGLHYLVCYADGSMWGTMWNPGVFPEEARIRLAERIAQRSEIPITAMKVFESKDHSCPAA